MLNPLLCLVWGILLRCLCKCSWNCLSVCYWPNSASPVSSPLSSSILSATSPAVSGLPPLSTIFQTHIPIIHHVPKGARDCWASKLNGCLSSIVHNYADLSQWIKLFMLIKCVLASPAAGHRFPWREIFQLVRSPLQRWFAGDLANLWSKARTNGQAFFRRGGVSASSISQQSSNVRSAKRDIQDSQYRKVIQAFTSEGLASPSPKVIQEMQAKHPQASPPILPLAHCYHLLGSLSLLSAGE